MRNSRPKRLGKLSKCSGALRPGGPSGPVRRARFPDGLRRCLLILLLSLVFLMGGTTANAGSSGSDYDSREAGHPLRVAAYILHPVGVILDTLIFRPAYWLGSHEPFKTLVGNTD